MHFSGLLSSVFTSPIRGRSVEADSVSPFFKPRPSVKLLFIVVGALLVGVPILSSAYANMEQCNHNCQYPRR
jgi:hypothetical protein